jgi:hypothetical protein
MNLRNTRDGPNPCIFLCALNCYSSPGFGRQERAPIGWESTSPNAYIADAEMHQLVALIFSCLLISESAGAETEHSATNSTPYQSVEEALTSLRSDPSITFSHSDGWTIAQGNSGLGYLIWSFTPPTHPAHPAAVKRTISQRSEAITISMEVICEAERSACDALISEFDELNEGIKQRLRGEFTE